ncbi:vesicle transport protein SFT2B-like [Mya arenaria]|uniref:vesicle transport protein SFT2B-like n=1 Tax=Mya arenaria TaxID=6604 RepID=UPI0022DEF9B8|nr:vesicle transport protein SFT2B-like [Mya arenaria]
MDKLKKTLSGNDDDEEQGIVGQFSDATTLSWSTRIKGFAICFILGVTLSIVGSCLLWMGSNGITLFAIFYTIGNIMSLSSTCFLMGPLNQLKKMFAQTRIFATILVVVMLILTLVCAFALKSAILTLMCCIIQFIALTWYSLSYIPFARDAVKKCFEGCIS